MVLDFILSFLLGLLTYCIHVMLKYNESKQKNKKRRKHVGFVDYLENNIVRLSVSLLSYIALWILFARIGNLTLVLGPLVLGKVSTLYVLSFLSGYASDSLFRNIAKIAQTGVNGMFGVNGNKNIK